MKIKQGSLCRNNGYVYAEIAITELPQDSEIHVASVTAQGIEIKCYLQIIKRNDTDCDTILVFPELSSASQCLVFRASDKNENLLEEARHAINNLLLIGQSKCNYLRRPQKMALIKATVSDSLYLRPDISLLDVLPDEERKECIVRISATVIARSRVELLVSVFDTSMHTQSSIGVILRQNIEKVTPHADATLYCIKTEASIRIPLELRDHVVLIGTADNPGNKGFSVLKKEMLFRHMESSAALWDASWQQSPAYHSWLNRTRVSASIAEGQRKAALPALTRFSIVVFLSETPLAFFEEMVSSIKEQSYPHWKLILVSVNLQNTNLWKAACAHCESDPRITCTSLSRDIYATQDTHSGAATATREFLCFLNNGDMIEPNTLFEYAQAISDSADIAMLYCDEDSISKDGLCRDPLFKPAFNIDMLRAKNYLSHFLAIRSSLYFELAPPIDECEVACRYDVAREYDLCLRVAEKAARVHHIAKVLYHRREGLRAPADCQEKDESVNEACRAVLKAHLERCGASALACCDNQPLTYITSYLFENNKDTSPLVSLIIPSKDNVALLSRCLQSILQRSTYPYYEIIVIENGSTEDTTFAYYDSLLTIPHIKVLTWREGWDYSRINNYGAQHASGDYLLFLNNDTEVISNNWIEQMLGIGIRKEIGVVGAKLLYPDNTTQHAGVFFGEGGPGHLFHNYPKSMSGYGNLNNLPQHLSAVTAACMLTRKQVFLEFGGFCEDFPIAYNDIDYCLRLREAGYCIVYTPYATLYHYESASRGYETTPEKMVRFAQDKGLLMSRWPEYFGGKDPCINPNIEKNSAYYRASFACGL